MAAAADRGRPGAVGQKRAALRRQNRSGSLRRAGVLASLVALSVAATGCLSSGLTYVSHRAADGVELYFTVPGKWKLYNAKQVVEAENGPLSQTQVNQIVNGAWINSFSAGRGSAKQLLDPSGGAPNGFAFARQLSATDRDNLNYAAMRAVVLGSDPLNTAGYNVLSYSNYTAAGGVRGIRLVTDIASSSGATETFAENIAVDPQTNWIFGIDIACRASCWGPNTSVIDSILRSWNVKELPR